MDILSMLEGYEYDIKNMGDNNITNLEIDSRKAKTGDAFFCIEGENADGHNYIESCYKKGVRVFIVSKNIPLLKDTTIIKVSNTKNCLAYISNKFYKEPSKAFKLIGVTGTNGKTSTTSFIESILYYAKNKVGSIGTLGIKFNKIDMNYKFSTSTTPDSIDLQRIFKKYVDNKVDYAIMEVSSHGLHLDRVSHCDFDLGIFTNLTQDHLDFHKTMKNYLQSKKKLFSMSKKCVVNIDDNYGKKIYEEFKNKSISIGIDNTCDYQAKNIIYGVNYVSFDITLNGDIHNFKILIPGKFTVYNALTAIVTSFILGIDINNIKEALATLSVEGRMEPVENKKGLNIFIDYAHTPDALESVLKCLNTTTKGKVITVFGCGGDRDKSKRPIMGKIASELSNITIITSDNPRTENPNIIINDILDGITKKENVLTFINREEAIKYAIKITEPDDCVIIAGKGHEDYQIIGTKKYDFDDYKIAKNFLSNHLSKPLTLLEVANAVNGKLNNKEYENLVVTSILRDTKDYLKGGLFFAIKGNNFNGHDFVLDTYNYGCICTIVDEDIKTKKPIIQVDNTREALLNLASYYRGLFDVKTIAITGSSGKTTTKDTIYSVLKEKYEVLKTEGNFNNEIGVPLTIFKLDEIHKVAVIELGMNNFGEILNLTKVVKPDIAVITNIGNAHLENLGSKEGVLKAKLEIVEGLRKNGTLIINGDDELLNKYNNDNLNIVTYGKNVNNDYVANNILNKGLDGISFNVNSDTESFTVTIDKLGDFMVYNALSAIIVGKILNLSKNNIVDGLRDLTLSKNRLDVITSNSGIKIINDTYNANPESMSASLYMLSELKINQNKVAIIGDMFELGDVSINKHKYIGTICNDLSIDLYIFVGISMKEAFKVCNNNKMYFANQEELLENLNLLGIKNNSLVLVKASRGMKLEKTVEKIKGW